MGRHRKPAHNRKAKGVPRLPSGRLSRSDEAKKLDRALQEKQFDQDERETLMPGLQARTQKFGVKPADAMDQYAGSVIGRLSLIGEKHGGISGKQMEVAQTWLEERAAYAAAVASPPDARAIDLGRTPGRSNAETPERDREIIAKHRAAREAVQAAQNVLGARSNLWAALNLLVEQDRGAPHLVGDLREALNALGHHYGIIPRKKQRAA